MRKILFSSFLMFSFMFGFDVKTWARADYCNDKQSENVCKMANFVYKYNVFYDRSIAEMLKMTEEKDYSEIERKRGLNAFYDYFKLALTNLNRACILWQEISEEEKEFLYLLEYETKMRKVPAIATSDFDVNNLWCKKTMNITSELFLGDFFETEYIVIRTRYDRDVDVLKNK